MSDLLAIGVSGLLAYRKALETTGHNVANVDTPGYSRQRVDLVARPGTPQGDGLIGGGVLSDTVQRLADALVAERLQGDTSAFARADTYAVLAARVDGWLSDVDSGLSRPLQGFYDALGQLAANPGSTATRQLLLGSGSALGERFADLQAQFDGLEQELNLRLAQTADEITRYAQGVADINQQIALARGQSGGQPPNDLLDQRDRLVQDIARRIGITTTESADGLNIYTGSGQALVLGAQATPLTLGDDAFRSGRQRLLYGGGQDITAQTRGGVIGGLLDFRREVLEPARSELGRLAAGVVDAMNRQHAAGMDLRGQMGGDFFVDVAGSVHAALANSGSAALEVQLSDAAALSGDELLLSYSGAGWQLTRSRDGSAVSFSGSGTTAEPLRAEGLSIVVARGAPGAGDRYLIQPTATAARQLRVAITDPAHIAAALPLRVGAALGNRGSGVVQELSVIDAGNASLRSAVRIEFIDANTYSVNGSGSFAWSAGSPIDVNGWSLRLVGVPAAGDRFEVTGNVAGSNDNGNARQLAALANRGLLNGGRDSVNAAQAALLGRVGAQAQQAGLQRGALETVRQQTLAEQQSRSGVNLDEEAAALVRFQQAYQAAARVIATANDVFQSLLDATG